MIYNFLRFRPPILVRHAQLLTLIIYLYTIAVYDILFSVYFPLMHRTNINIYHVIYTAIGIYSVSIYISVCCPRVRSYGRDTACTAAASYFCPRTAVDFPGAEQHDPPRLLVCTCRASSTPRRADVLVGMPCSPFATVHRTCVRLRDECGKVYARRSISHRSARALRIPDACTVCLVCTAQYHLQTKRTLRSENVLCILSCRLYYITKFNSLSITFTLIYSHLLEFLLNSMRSREAETYAAYCIPCQPLSLPTI